MENIVNLEQLDYRDRLIKEYIDEHSQPSSGGSQLFCELEVDTIYTEEEGEPDEAHLYIKCYKGTILESDELQFARNTATPSWHYTGEIDDNGVPVKILVKKRRGWIIPKPYNYVNLYKVYVEEKSAASELYDYWEVLPKNRDGEEVSWQELLDEFLEKRLQFLESKGMEYNHNYTFRGDSFANNYASFVNRWAGVAIKRDGQLISDYMLWQITGPVRGGMEQSDSFYKSGSFISKIAVDGRYYTQNGEDCFYHFSLRH